MANRNHEIGCKHSEFEACMTPSISGRKALENAEAWRLKACTLAQVAYVAREYGRLKKYQVDLIGKDHNDRMDDKQWGMEPWNICISANVRTLTVNQRKEERAERRRLLAEQEKSESVELPGQLKQYCSTDSEQQSDDIIDVENPITRST